MSEQIILDPRRYFRKEGIMRVIETKLLLMCLFMAAYLTLTALEVRSSFGFDNSFIEYNSNTQYQAMLSWQPQIDHTIWQKDNLSISSFMEFSSSLRLDLTDEAQNYSPEAEVYRSWIRFANSSSELRVGLQKLNFGTARIFRPLQWFDQLQFLDLFERTGGTMAILMRKHFTQTGSLWLWGVTEDLDATYKYPLSLSESGLGGRYELSLPWLESAFSFHHRYGHSMPEKHRIGFETRLDGWIGFWTESSLLISKTKQQSNMLSLSNTCGLDYTIPWKNGLYLLAETNAQHSNSHLLSKVEPVDVQTAFMADYPLGILDRIIIISSRDWTSGTESYSLVLRRIYDHLSIELSGGLIDSTPKTRMYRLAFNYTI